MQSTLVRFFIFIINCYKKIPLKPVCRFVPSCSEYALINLKKSGIKAVFKIIFRILRCNPFSKRKVDL